MCSLRFHCLDKTILFLTSLVPHASERDRKLEMDYFYDSDITLAQFLHFVMVNLEFS